MSRNLYISARCDHCIHVLKGVHQYSFLKELFNIINVDTTPFPQNITSVPCISIQDQLIYGNMVFEYLGKLVEGKEQAANARTHSNTPVAPENSQCGVQNNDDDTCDLDGYCCDDNGLNCSIITEKDDNNTLDIHKFNSSLEFLTPDSNTSIHQQVSDYESSDKLIETSKDGFDSDFEKLQRERGDLMLNKH